MSKFFTVERVKVFMDMEETIKEHINIEQIVSIEGYILEKSASRKGYIIYLSNGRSYNIYDREYQKLMDLIENNK